ncbi:MAG: protein kinase [Polyangiales bacterium]
MTSQAPSPLPRFEDIRVLGRGGAGEVHLVRDRETGEKLALKRLLRADNRSMLRLKREFRSLADVHHPNLVKLYELGHDHTSPYFTMEYLDGDDLETFLERSRQPSAAANDNAAGHVARVMRVFLQLASAVSALHTAGLLHRDLKPSNVMVSDGRVVVLDFGIALEVGDAAATVTQDKLASGTPAYMAPEQIHGEHLGQPNDWYAFGVMLYEALSGRLPFDGPLHEVLERKLTEAPPPIDSLVAGVPSPISALCMALLRRAPQERPNGEQVLGVLRAHTAISRAPTLSSTVRSDAPATRGTADTDLALFGREPELAALWTAFRSVQAGDFAAVHVSGTAGSGKSLLVQRFSEDVEARGFSAGESQPLVLRSRCYERETLPFKALDGAVDALVEHLLRESDIVVGHTMPHDGLPALAQLFPSLQRLPVMQRLLQNARRVAVTTQARSQAEAALQELLRRLGAQRPIVLWIDDLQWGDLDSTSIIASWLSPPLLPHVMLVLSYRSDEVSTSPCLTLLRQRGAGVARIETVLSLRALGDEHVRALCSQRFALADIPVAAQLSLTERIVREAQGSPFLASQLVALAVTQPGRGEGQLASLTLEELVRSRSSTLSAGARRMLNVLSVAGRPITLTLVLRCAEIESQGRALVHELQGLHLIRTRNSGQDRLLEVYHDRLREVVQSLLAPAERLDLDRRLLSALREAGSSDYDWQHALALAIDDRAAALSYGLAAAKRASDMLAFERAAELYERCVKLTDVPAADGGKLYQQLADAYAHAGHGGKAAAAYLQAAACVDAEHTLPLERAAASHLLCSGRFDEGEALLRKTTQRFGIEAPSTDAGLYAALAWERVRMAVRGLEYEPRSLADSSPEQVSRAELCGLVSMETAAYDPLRAALFQARCLRMALDAGEPAGLARALCAAATMACVSGSERGARRADELLRRAEAISKTVDQPVVHINFASARAICAFLLGRLRESIELAYHAEHLHRTSTEESEYHHRFTIASARIGALLQLGEYPRAELELQAYLKEAEATENINAQLHISMAYAWADVIADRLSTTITRLDKQREQLPHQGFGILHTLHMISVHRVGSATGEYHWALHTSDAHWQAFQRSVVRRSDAFSMFAYEAHARLLLNRCVSDAAARGGAGRAVAPHLAALARCTRRDAHAEVARIKARLALLKGDRAGARRLLAESSALFEQHGARDQTARDRYALGALMGGHSGEALMLDALAVLRDLGIAQPLRELRGHYPELVPATP